MDRMAPPPDPQPWRQFEELVRCSPLAVAVFDREMRYLAYNENWLASHGRHEPTSLTGRSHYEVFPEIREEWRAIHRRCLAGATERSDRDHFDRPDGSREYLRWVVAPWHELDGEVAGLVIFVENITAQVATEERLANREGIIRAFFERSPVGLNLCRMDGLWLESNPAFLDIIGYSREEADGGLTYWQLTPRKYDADEAVQLEHLRTRRRYGPYEKEFIRKDGRLIPVRLNGFLVERDGEEFIWSLIEDLTAQRALERSLEEERVKAIQMSKLASLGEMAASFAHEINNPLGIIDGYAFALRGAIAAGDGAEVDAALEAIRDAVGRAGKIVQGLRRFARQGKDEATEVFQLRALIEESLDLCRARIQSHGIALEVAITRDVALRGHSIELAQVLVNLLNNAFDAAQAGPAPRWIRLSAGDGPAADVVAIRVEDSGGGVGPELAADIFRPFFTTKPVGHGTGLGLSISRSIVERHRGSLAIDPAAAHTTFVVSLPRAEP